MEKNPSLKPAGMKMACKVWASKIDEKGQLSCVKKWLPLMLGLHYVPGSHGSHGSQKRSSPWCFSYFCLCVQVLLSLATFSHGLSRSAVI